MSFAITTEQIRNRTKDVTRRVGWWFLKPGDLVQACVKCMGIPKGSKVEKLCVIRVKSVRSEEIGQITPEDVVREGFPKMSVVDFILMFDGSHKLWRGIYTPVNRIEFEYVDEVAGATPANTEEKP